jgi:hypothetical protein
MPFLRRQGSKENSLIKNWIPAKAGMTNYLDLASKPFSD